jgi:hypothetical protein
MENIKNFMLRYILKFKILFFLWGVVGCIITQFLHHKPIIGLFVALSALASLIFFVYVSIEYMYYTDDDFITYKKPKK